MRKLSAALWVVFFMPVFGSVEVSIDDGVRGYTADNPLYSPTTINFAAWVDPACPSGVGYHWDVAPDNVYWTADSTKFGIMFGGSSQAGSIAIGEVSRPSTFLVTVTTKVNPPCVVETASRIVHVAPPKPTVDPPVDPPADPCAICSTYPQLCPEECLKPPDPPPVAGRTLILPLRTVDPFDTGIFLQAATTSQCSLVFWRSQSPPSKEGKKVATFTETLGKNNPIIVPVRVRYLTKDEVADSVRVSCDVPFVGLSVWFAKGSEYSYSSFPGLKEE